MNAVSCDMNENNLTQPFGGRHTATRGHDILHASRALKILCWQINGHSRRWVVGWKEVPFISETLVLYENAWQPVTPVRVHWSGRRARHRAAQLARAGLPHTSSIRICYDLDLVCDKHNIIIQSTKGVQKKTINLMTIIFLKTLVFYY